MLAQMRGITRSWPARIFLGLLAIGMAVTLFQGDFLSGLTGMFNPSGVARVGNQSVSQQVLNREFDLFLRSAQRQDRAVTREQAISEGLPSRVLDMIVQRRAMQRYAESLGVRASNAQLSEAIRSLPTTKNEVTGQFDRTAYQGFLREIGYGAGEFETEMRGDLASSQLVQALTAGTRPPASYGALVLAYQSERRVASVAQVRAEAAGAIPEPTVAQLRDLYQDARAAFAVPEYRALTLVYARASDFAARIEVPEARIRAEFDARRASLTTPERRSFVQLAAPNEVKARDAARRLTAGEAPDAVATALGLQLIRQEERAHTDIADPAVRSAVFAASAGAPAQAVQAQLSPWAAVQVTAIIPAVAPSYESARQQVHDELAGQEGAGKLDEAITAFENARDSGTPLAEAARTNGLAVVVVPAVDAQGRTPQGAPAEALIDQTDIIATAFQITESEPSDFAPVADGVDVIVSVDRITPASTKPFEAVQTELRARYLARERARRLNELGEQVKAAVENGQSFAQAAAAARIPIVIRSQLIDRQSASRLPDTQLAGLLFSTAPRSVQFGVRGASEGLVVVYVESVERADPANNGEQIEALREQMQQQVGQSLVTAIEESAVRKVKVQRNPALIQRMFSPTAADEQSGPAS